MNKKIAKELYEYQQLYEFLEKQDSEKARTLKERLSKMTKTEEFAEFRHEMLFKSYIYFS